MSQFFNPRLSGLKAYTPGEQPRDRIYIKLNTNESSYPPSKGVRKAINRQRIDDLRLYCDPEATKLKAELARVYDKKSSQIFVSNGSDDILNFAFLAFGADGILFPDISYGFYEVFANLHGLPYETVPLKEDFSIDINDYCGVGKTIFLANPNAPTGLCLPLSDIETIVKSNPDTVVVIDEAYIDFGGESAVPLIRKYDNLLVIQTFSKSRSMAGARLGLGIGCRNLIRDLNTIKYSTNPYNINRMTMAAGIGALEDDAYFRNNCRAITENRAWTAGRLTELGFTLTNSVTNFLFARHDAISGKALYSKLREQGILVRHFDTPRLTDYVRITVGSRSQMEAFVAAVIAILQKL